MTVRILVIPNMTREKAPAVTRDVIAELKKLGTEFFLDSGVSESFKDIAGLRFMDAKKAAECDVIIAVGGDGSLIHAAKYASAAHVPLLGVNAGGLAFMAGLEGDETHLLSCLLSGDYTVDRRMMLKVNLIDSDGDIIHSSYCVNDAAVTRGANMHQLTLSLYRNGKLLNSYNADGLIASTPTGSTAYSLSAGGPIIEPAVQCIVVTPVCTHAMMSRAVVLRDDAAIDITVPFMGSGAVLSCDGLDSVGLTPNCKIEIRKAPVTCDLIRIKGSSFIDVLKDKFNNRLL